MPNSLNRRKFLQTGALAGAAGFWSPSLQAQRIDIASGDIGKSNRALDSPALCVDLDRMAQNIKAVQTSLHGTGVSTRPHVKTHKCPEIAKMQVAAGAVGGCAAKLSESEIMLNNGISNVLMTGVNVTVPKIQKPMPLRKTYRGLTQAISNHQNARDHQEAP